MPELAHQGIFQLQQDHCGWHNYLFSKNYTLYGVYISLNFGFRLNRLAFNDAKTLFFIYQKLFKDKKNYLLGSNFKNLKENPVK